MRNLVIWLLICFAGVGALGSTQKNSHKCLVINSYYKGYAWSDGIQEAIHSSLKDHCSMETFYLGARLNNSQEFTLAKALEAKKWIEAKNPDVVIVMDDVAIEHVLARHFRNSSLPFVFCGLNWNTNKLGPQLKNATGMVEIAPVDALIVHVKSILPFARTGVYLSGDVQLDRDNFRIYRDVYSKSQIRLVPLFAKDMKDWEKKYIEAQGSDFVIIANYSGIQDWSLAKAQQIVTNRTSKLSVTYQEFLTSIAAFSLTKIPAEQGEWAAQVAIEILKGTKPEWIPIAVNRRWNLYINPEIALLSRTRFSATISRKASKAPLPAL